MNISQKPYRVADYVMEKIADYGIKDVFYLPGGGAMYLDDALYCEKRLNGVICQHEQACGIAAEANGRTNEAGFGVAVVTTGPGATNILTPVAGAWIESLPMLILSGQVKRSDGLQGRPLRQGGVQEVDIISMVKSITKYVATINDPLDIRYKLEEALWKMKHGRAGPVWIDIPLDVQAAPIDPNFLKGFTPPHDAPENISESDFKKLEQLIKQSKRPLILAGHGIRISGGASAFKLLLEKLGIPSVFTWNASDLLHFNHPLYIGRPGVVAARAPNFAIQNSDLLISIGCRLDNVITAYNPKGFARAAKKIVIDIDKNELARHTMPIDLPLCMDAKVFIDAWLKNYFNFKVDSRWLETCSSWKKRFTALEGRPQENEGSIGHYQFINQLSKAIPENRLVITGSSGLAIEVLYTVFQNKKDQRMFLTSGLGSMGYGLPAAIGACYGAKRTPTICVESDGSLMLNLQELVTMKAQELPIILIVMNNGGYASIRNTQKNYFNGRYLGTGPESGLLIPNIVDISKAIGLPAKRINNASSLFEELEDAIKQKGPYVCEILLESEESLSPKVAAIPQTDGSMISMPLEDMSPLLSIEALESEMIIPLENQSYLARK
jgi:acetolactate synthase-1/2/3 large subunit